MSPIMRSSARPDQPPGGLFCVCTGRIPFRSLAVNHLRLDSTHQFRVSACVARLSFIPPMLPTLVEKPPEGDDWIHEVKFDGWRGQIIIDEYPNSDLPETSKSSKNLKPRIRVFTRNGHDWTEKFHPLVDDASKIGVESAIIDGEIIVPNEVGLSDFHALRSAINKRPHDLYFVAFDLLHLNGHDLRRMKLQERRDILENLIADGGRIQFSQSMEGSGTDIFAKVEKAGIEGIVSKRLSSRYGSGRTMEWRKIKSVMESTYEVLGVEREVGKPAFALMAEPGTRKYVGSAFVTLNREMRERLWRRVKEKPGLAPKEFGTRPATQWTAPGLIARVKHLRGEEKLRHARLLDIREEE